MYGTYLHWSEKYWAILLERRRLNLIDPPLVKSLETREVLDPIPDRSVDNLIERIPDSFRSLFHFSEMLEIHAVHRWVSALRKTLESSSHPMDHNRIELEFDLPESSQGRGDIRNENGSISSHTSSSSCTAPVD